jgi:hypothetical protein
LLISKYKYIVQHNNGLHFGDGVGGKSVYNSRQNSDVDLADNCVKGYKQVAGKPYYQWTIVQQASCVSVSGRGARQVQINWYNDG